ncbi:MAG: oligosaccharide flippase family protein [Myxococcales bacterium]
MGQTKDRLTRCACRPYLRPMQIVHMGPASDVPVLHRFGGAVQRRIWEMARVQARRGDRVVVYSFGDRTETRLVDGVELRFVHCVTPHPPRQLEFLGRALADLARRDRHVDVAHFHGVPEGGLLAQPVADLTALSFDYFVFRRGRRMPWAPLYRRALSSFDLLLPCSQYCLAESSTYWNLPPERMDVLFNGVNLDQFSPDRPAGERERRELGLEDPVLLYVGRVCEQKGSDVLLEAYRRLRARGVRAHLVLAGPVGQFGRAEQGPWPERIAQAGGAYLGPVEEERLAAVYNMASALVMPTVAYENVRHGGRGGPGLRGPGDRQRPRRAQGDRPRRLRAALPDRRRRGAGAGDGVRRHPARAARGPGRAGDHERRALRLGPHLRALRRPGAPEAPRARGLGPRDLAVRRAGGVARAVIPSLRAFWKRHRERLFPAGSLRGRFASGLFWSLFAAVLSRSFNLAASIGCARLMGQAGFGELGMVLSTVNTLGAFSVLGLGLTATRFVAEYRESDPARVARILKMSSVASLVSGGVMSLALVALAPWLSARILSAPSLSAPLALGATMVLFNAVLSFQTGALSGFEAFRALARAGGVSGLLAFPLTLLGAWKGGVHGAVAGNAASLLVNVLLNHRLLREQRTQAGLDGQDSGWRREAPVFWSFSLPAFLASFTVAPALWACNALLASRPQGYPQLGLYTAADRWRVALLFVPATVFRFVLPMLSNLEGRSDAAGFRRVNRANLLLNLGLVALPAVALSLLSKTIMSGYGPGFKAGWPILAVLALGTLPEALNTILGYPLIIARRMWTRFSFDVLLALVMATVGALLIPRWGATGLAVAYVSAFSSASLALYLFTRWTKPLAAAAPPPDQRLAVSRSSA